MRHEHDSSRRTGGTAAMLAISATLLGACGEGAADSDSVAANSDPNLFMFCAESRGSLLELDSMLSGRKRVDTSTLSHGSGNLTRLADRVSAPDTVRKDIGRWNTAVQTWLDQLRAMPPRFENGLVVEPDTTKLDQTLIVELKVVGKPLGDWVNKTCENVRL